MKSHAPTLERRHFLASLTGMLGAMVTTNTALADERPTFFISESGNDSADGLTPDTAWATIQKANARLPSESVALFRRGDTFFGELSLPFGCRVGAYGVGARPTLTMFKLLNRMSGWREEFRGVWSIDLGSSATHDGYTATADANIGYLMVDGVVRSAKRTSLSELSAEWDFYCDMTANVLYVAAMANPAASTTDIKAAPRGTAGRIVGSARGANIISDLHITGTGAHGIAGTGPDVQVRNCVIDFIGGSFLPGYRDGTTRYGNGIENGISSMRWLVENNEIAQIYDVAYTCQGFAYDSRGFWEDMTIRNNHIHDCTQSFEFWAIGSSQAPGFKRILIEGNLCERAGFSDFADARPNQSNRVHLLTYNWDVPADITIRDNVFDGAYNAYTYQLTKPIGLITEKNIIRLEAGTKMQVQRRETVEHSPEWQAATGQELGSAITVLP